MGLTLKHVERTKSGSFQYRRRVPKDVSTIITKREFKRKLGESEREALAAYPRFHAEVEKEIAEAKLGRVRSEAASSAKATEREAYAEALRRWADLVAAGVSPSDLELTADSMAEAYPHGWDYEPEGVPPVERHTINLLRLGPERYKAPEPTLGDATAFYLKERGGNEPPEAIHRFEVATKRIVGLVAEALGRDPVLSSLTREDARNVRNYMLDRLTATGKRRAPSSVARDLNGLNAIINFTAKELPLPGTFMNPFSGVSVTKVKGQSSESENRDPLPEKVLKAVTARIVGHAKAELALIWRMLEGTGCRLSEVSGLLIEDVNVSGDLPSIRVTWRENRRIKTAASRRYVPLVGDALEAAKDALKLPRKGNLLFPAYGQVLGGNKASAALMAHVRKVTTDPNHVVHSLRHNMRDRLMLAEVASLDQNLIMGWSLGGVGDRVYGGDTAKLRVTTRAMKRAFGILETKED